MAPMENIHIRKVRQAEAEQLQQISRQTFFETFAAYNTEANMRRYLDKDFSLDKLTAELANPDAQFYFAWLNDAVIGYLKLNFGPAQTAIKDENTLEIERIYVLKDYHGKKVGQLLFEKAMQVARAQKAAYVWLGVWEENVRAINFYKKQGFNEFDKHIFMLGDDAQTDLLMRLPLQA